MPGSFVHEQVARRAYAEISGAFPRTDLHMEALLAGAMGPDPLFMYRLYSRRRNAGMFAWALRMHREATSDFLCALCERTRGGDPLLRGYALGFLTHYATDSTLHPYVYAHSFDAGGRYSSDAHGDLEMAMETWLYRALGGDGAPRTMESLRSLGGGEQVRILQALLGAMRRAYGDAPTQEQALTAFSDCALISRMIRSRYGVKRRILILLGTPLRLGGTAAAHIPPARLPDYDFLNLAHMAWASPWEREELRRESVPELLEKAQARSVRYMQKALAYWQGEVTLAELHLLLGDKGYDSGISWRESFHLDNADRPPEACQADIEVV